MTKRAVRVARMFDGERLVDGGVLVLLDEGRIAEVHLGNAEAPEGWSVREEPNGTLLPGLVDAHVHLCADAGPDALGRLADRPESDLDGVVEASLRTHLAAGVTTVRDLGDRRDAVLRWRDRGCVTTFRRWWGRAHRSPASAGTAGRWGVRRAVSTGSARPYVCGRRSAPIW